MSDDKTNVPAVSGDNPPGQPAAVDVLLSQLPAIAETLSRSQVEQRKVEIDGRIAEVRLMNEGRSEEMAVRERMANARFEHDRSMEREQRRFDRLILAGVFLLYAAAIVYGMYANNMAVLASGLTGLVSFVAGFNARGSAPRSSPHPSTRE